MNEMARLLRSNSDNIAGPPRLPDWKLKPNGRTATPVPGGRLTLVAACHARDHESSDGEDCRAQLDQNRGDRSLISRLIRPRSSSDEYGFVRKGTATCWLKVGITALSPDVSTTGIVG
jgi:hypothetical protein